MRLTLLRVFGHMADTRGGTGVNPDLPSSPSAAKATCLSQRIVVLLFKDRAASL
jgi:hypothetical protein